LNGTNADVSIFVTLSARVFCLSLRWRAQRARGGCRGRRAWRTWLAGCGSWGARPARRSSRSSCPPPARTRAGRGRATRPPAWAPPRRRRSACTAWRPSTCCAR
jgi:hypothetical protein